MLHPAEENFIGAFITATRQERYRTHLADPRRRRRMPDRLNHDLTTDLRGDVVREPLSGTVEEVARQLRSLGACGEAHLISDDAGLDGRTLPMMDALQRLLNTEWGTVACCADGLAVYRPEAPGQALLLIKGS